MNPITVVIIFILFLGFIVIQIAKKMILGNLDTSLRKKDYALTVKICDMSMARRLLGNYTCDLYKIKGYYLAKDIEKFDQMLNHILETEYKNPDDKKAFIELYYHIFIIKENKKYADILLAEIRKIGDEDFIKYNEQAYEVMINGRNDLAEEMDHEIDSKKFYGFSLGVILYMIAIQYERLNKYEKAITYFENAIVCFHPSEKYVALSKEHIAALKNKG